MPQLKSNRHFSYMYLDALFLTDPIAATEYSDELVDLYAEYEPPRLMDILRKSTSYGLEKAYNICKARDYVPEMVFLLGRMGNNKQALSLIIERLGDVQKVSKSTHDDESLGRAEEPFLLCPGYRLCERAERSRSLGGSAEV